MSGFLPKVSRCTHGFCEHALCRLLSVFMGVCAEGDGRGDHAVSSGAIPHVETRRQGALICFQDLVGAVLVLVCGYVVVVVVDDDVAVFVGGVVVIVSTFKTLPPLTPGPPLMPSCGPTFPVGGNSAPPR